MSKTWNERETAATAFYLHTAVTKKGKYPYYISPIEIGLLWGKITYLKSAGMLFLSIVQRDIAWGFQKSYYTSQ